MRKLIVLIILVSLGMPSKASHVIGYDFDYICLGANTYQFTLAVYRDCRPQSQGGGLPDALLGDNPAFIGVYSNGILIGQQDVEASFVEIVPPFFSNNCVLNPPVRCNSKMVFQFTQFLPPNPDGYTLAYQRCCRNGATLNINLAGSTGNTFVTTIPPNDNSCNNSAKFNNAPPQIICINNPFVFDCSASDIDGDSLTYEFCPGLAGGGAGRTPPNPPNSPNTPKPKPPLGPPYLSIQYAQPYTPFNPIASNPTISIDPSTGVITGTPTLSGIFAISVCCNEYRNGTLINIVRREFQVNVTNCSKAVVANIPVLADEPNTYQINCKDRVINFINNSTGGFSYYWDFGVPGITTDVSTAESPTYIYPDTGTFIVKLVVNPGSTCPDSIERIVKIYPTFNADYSFAGLFCPDLPINFTDLSTSTTFPVNYWDWNFDDGTRDSNQNVAHSFPNIGKEFNVTLISGNTRGCRDTISKKLNIPKVNLDAGNDTVVLMNEFVQFNATGTQTYNWSPPDFLNNPNIANPLGYYTDTGVYRYIVTGTTADGCPASDDINVTVSDKAYLIVPNAFTPNGDGKNDVLRLLSSGFKKINHYRIFNRWGQMVFETNDYYQGWDGRLGSVEQQTSTYFWVVSVVDLNDNVRVFQGDVTLIR